MSETTLTEQDGQRALRDHVVGKALAAREACGRSIDFDSIVRLLENRSIVRFPLRLRFNAEPLFDGEFAVVSPCGDSPRDGFNLDIHPCFEGRRDVLPLLIAYHLVRVNYGDIVSHVEAELFGATLCGMDVDEYYETLCRLVDEMPRAA